MTLRALRQSCALTHVVGHAQMERERDEAMRIAALRAEDGYLVEEKQGLAKIQRLFRQHNSERLRQQVL